MKNWMRAVLFAVLLLATPLTVKAAGTVEVSPASGVKNETVYVTVTASGFEKADSLGVQFQYDTEKLDFISSKSRWELEGVLSNIDPVNKTAVWAASAPVDVNKTIITLAFRVLSDLNEETAVTCDVVMKNNGTELLRTSETSKITLGCIHKLGAAVKFDEDVHKQTCSLCGYEIVFLHSFGEGKELIAPTETQKGKYEYTCSECGYVKTVETKTTAEEKGNKEEQKPEATNTPDNNTQNTTTSKENVGMSVPNYNNVVNSGQNYNEYIDKIQQQQLLEQQRQEALQQQQQQQQILEKQQEAQLKWEQEQQQQQLQQIQEEQHQLYIEHQGDIEIIDYDEEIPALESEELTKPAEESVVTEEPAVTEETTTVQKEQKSSSVWPIMIVICVFAAAAVVVFAFVTFKKRKK